MQLQGSIARVDTSICQTRGGSKAAHRSCSQSRAPRQPVDAIRNVDLVKVLRLQFDQRDVRTIAEACEALIKPGRI